MNSGQWPVLVQLFVVGNCKAANQWGVNVFIPTQHALATSHFF